MKARALRFKGMVLLLLAAMIWGFSGVTAQSGLMYIQPGTFNCLRMLLACATVAGYMAVHPRMSLRREMAKLAANPKALVGNVLCGAFMFAATTFQQYGLQRTTVGKAGFITSLYMVLVPVFGVMTGKRYSLLIWCCVLAAAGGLYLLCGGAVSGFTLGDGFILICAVMSAIQILLIDAFSPGTNGYLFSLIQFATSAVLSGATIPFEGLGSLCAILKASGALLYGGILTCGVGYTLQVVGMRATGATVSSVILSLESVFAALSGWLVLGQAMNRVELLGCAVIFAAIVLIALNPSGDTKGKKRRFKNA